MKNLTLNIFMMGKVLLGKDVELVPKTLGKMLNTSVNIVSLRSPWNRNFPKDLNGIHYKFLLWNTKKRPNYFKLPAFWIYLILNAKKINILLRFHFGLPSAIETIIYKIFNKKGIVYCKMDASEDIVKRYSNNPRLSIFTKIFIKKFLTNCDIFSIETKKVYNSILASKSDLLPKKEKLVYVPNGFDENIININNIKLKNFEEKENIILCVGRHGSYQKNSELLLNALKQISSPKNKWKLIFIGSSENSFKENLINIKFENIEIEYHEHIYDKKQLYNYYNNSKIFVLPSRDESSGLVLIEAFRFNNFIISTPVGAAPDIIKENINGKLFPNNDVKSLAIILDKCLNENMDISKTLNVPFNLDWENTLSPIKSFIENKLKLSK